MIDRITGRRTAGLCVCPAAGVSANQGGTAHSLYQNRSIVANAAGT